MLLYVRSDPGGKNHRGEGVPFCPKYLTWSGRSRFRGLQNNVKLILKSILILYLTECFPERRSKIVENAILKDLQFKTFWGGAVPFLRPPTCCLRHHIIPSPNNLASYAPVQTFSMLYCVGVSKIRKRDLIRYSGE